jgi:hypothetical protein
MVTKSLRIKPPDSLDKLSSRDFIQTKATDKVQQSMDSEVSED